MYLMCAILCTGFIIIGLLMCSCFTGSCPRDGIVLTMHELSMNEGTDKTQTNWQHQCVYSYKVNSFRWLFSAISLWSLFDGFGLPPLMQRACALAPLTGRARSQTKTYYYSFLRHMCYPSILLLQMCWLTAFYLWNFSIKEETLNRYCH